MRILFATQAPAMPQAVSGNPSSMNELLLSLRELGDEVGVLCGFRPDGWLGLRNRLFGRLSPRRRCFSDEVMGYPSFRGWRAEEAAEEVVHRFRPDAVVAQTGKPIALARAFLKLGVPSAVYVRDVEFQELGGTPAPDEQIIYFANSRFTASRLRDTFGVQAIVAPPLVRPGNYKSETSREVVTFVNPIPIKGLEIAFGLARARPDIPFEFREAWKLSPEDREQLRRRASAHPNVTIQPRTTDKRELYRRSRVIVAPSQWEEAWGRVATEAHINGIPVLASSIGGLPESVGPGGLTLAPDAPTEVWAEALGRMWDDEAYYATLCRAAAEYSRRPEIDPQALVTRLRDSLIEHVQNSSRARTKVSASSSFGGSSG